MYQRSFTVLALTFALICAPAGTAAADELPRLDERTALMIAAKRLRVGILTFDYAVIEQVSVGTDSPASLARAVRPVFVPDLRLEAPILQRAPMVPALQDAISKQAGTILELRLPQTFSVTTLGHFLLIVGVGYDYPYPGRGFVPGGSPSPAL